jgi:serine protease Do
MRTVLSSRKAAPALALLALWVASLACAGGGGETPAPVQTDAPVVTQASVGPSSRGAISSVDDVKSATIQIVAEGTLVMPGGTVPNANWSGSGFIIDPSGIAVTNNHVVTGAARMKVLVGGEDEPRNARVLGVAECSDLAVIDIDGDGFPFMAWREGSADVGLDVYAAGFPLGDPEYTLTRGIVSKARADGDRAWTSVDYVLEHDANIQPGNSGGPLVDEDGKVVGVNYSGGFAALSSQFYAIAQAEAIPVIEQLREGKDVYSLGLNGEAFVDAESGFSGIWVTSVTSGSVMDKAGVQPGDIISSLEGISLGRGGTMGEYCDVLKSHDPEDTLAIEVIRFASGEVLSGQLNGRELAIASTFGSGSGGTSDDGSTGAYGSYVAWTDSYEAIQIEVPEAWGEVTGDPWVDGGDVIGAQLIAAPNIQDYLNSWGTPGVTFSVSDDLARLGGYVQLLDIYRETYLKSCEFDARYEYEDSAFRGKYDVFEKCGGSGGPSELVLAAVPKSSSADYLILVEVTVVSDADLEALDRILASFDVVGSLP